VSSPNVPNPPGWQTLADMMHGTLASIDLCPSCLEDTGLRVLMATSIRDRAVGELRKAVETDPDKMPPALNMAELEERIRNGDFDAAFASGDGIDLDAIAAESEIADAELVEAGNE
jgi:hypothetical protein